MAKYTSPLCTRQSHATWHIAPVACALGRAPSAESPAGLPLQAYTGRCGHCGKLRRSAPPRAQWPRGLWNHAPVPTAISARGLMRALRDPEVNPAWPTRVGSSAPDDRRRRGGRRWSETRRTDAAQSGWAAGITYADPGGAPAPDCTSVCTAPPVVRMAPAGSAMPPGACEKSSFPIINRKGGVCGTRVSAFYTFSTAVEEAVEKVSFSPAKCRASGCERDRRRMGLQKEINGLSGLLRDATLWKMPPPRIQWPSLLARASCARYERSTFADELGLSLLSSQLRPSARRGAGTAATVSAPGRPAAAWQRPLSRAIRRASRSTEKPRLALVVPVGVARRARRRRGRYPLTHRAPHRPGALPSPGNKVGPSR